MAAAYLYIGDIEHLRKQLRHELTSQLSPASVNDDGRLQHERVLWLKLTRRQYRREDIASVFQVAQYERLEHEPYMIVIEHADCFTYAAANSMLKLLEEPPEGYYIFLLASRQDAVVDTIRSRCQVYHYVSQQAYTHHDLYRAFTQTHQLQMHHIDDALSERIPTEYETQILLDALYAAWMERYRDALSRGIYHEQRWSERMLSLISKAYTYAPVSGNVKVFWRVLCLQTLTWRDQ